MPTPVPFLKPAGLLSLFLALTLFGVNRKCRSRQTSKANKICQLSVARFLVFESKLIFVACEVGRRTSGRAAQVQLKFSDSVIECDSSVSLFVGGAPAAQGHSLVWWITNALGQPTISQHFANTHTEVGTVWIVSAVSAPTFSSKL